jgi:hypothetical protein
MDLIGRKLKKKQKKKTIKPNKTKKTIKPKKKLPGRAFFKTRVLPTLGNTALI